MPLFQRIPPFKRPLFFLLATFVLLGMALFITYPILSLDSWYKALQAYRYPYMGEEFYKIFQHGFWYPRWLPNLMGGYGSPNFVYYQPGVFYYFLIFRFFTTDILLAVKIGLFLMFVMGGLGVYALARLYCRPLFSLVCVVLYMAMEQFATILHLFGNYSEIFAGLLCPWILFFLLLAARRIEGRQALWGPLVGLTLASTALIYSHPFVTYFFMPALGVIALGLLLDMDKAHRGPFIIATVACMVMALALSSPYWFTLWQLSGEIEYKQPSLQQFRTIGMRTLFTGFFEPPRHPLYRAFSGDPYYWVYYFALAYLGFAFGLLRKPRLFLLTIACMLLWGFLTTKYSLWMWNHVPLMKLTQFPRRLATGLTAIMMLGIVQVVSRLDEQHALSPNASRKKWIAAIAVLMACVPLTNFLQVNNDGSIAYQHSHLPKKSINYEWFVHKTDSAFSDMTHTHEFNPIYSKSNTLKHRARGSVPLVEVIKGKAEIVLQSDLLPYRIEFSADAKPPKGKRRKKQEHAQLWIAINQFYLKGWRVTVNGEPVELTHDVSQSADDILLTADKAGRMLLALPAAGSYRVTAWYDGPPGWQYRNLIICIIVTAGTMVLYRMFRRYGRHSPTEPL